MLNVVAHFFGYEEGRWQLGSRLHIDDVRCGARIHMPFMNVLVWVISYRAKWPSIVYGTWMGIFGMRLTAVVRGHCTVLDAIACRAVCLAGRMTGGVKIGGSSYIFLKLRLWILLASITVGYLMERTWWMLVDTAAGGGDDWGVCFGESPLLCGDSPRISILPRIGLVSLRIRT